MQKLEVRINSWALLPLFSFVILGFLCFYYITVFVLLSVEMGKAHWLKTFGPKVPIGDRPLTSFGDSFGLNWFLILVASL